MDCCRHIVSLLVLLPAAAGSAAAQQFQPVPLEDTLVQSTKSPYAFFEPGPVQEAILHADGSRIEVETETLWRPICGSSIEGVTPEHFRQVVQAQRLALQNAKVAQADQGQTGAQRGSGFDVIFTNLSGFGPTEIASLAQIETIIESQFSDDITITINISFANLGSCGIIGGTGSSYVITTWPTARDGLMNGMDADDTIQTHVPSGSTIPVRYNGNSSTVTNETRVFVTFANYRATVGTVSGLAASMQYNSNCSFDFDPSDGVSGLDFQSVVVHEVGHAMGFTSGADFRTNDIEMLDVYRFQRSDGAGDFNPDTLAEFSATARMVDQNAPGTNDDVISDLISVEHRMSDGSPWQASHFREQAANIGIMDPALDSGQTFWPNFYKTPDNDMFDAIGWDFSASSPMGACCSSNGSCSVTTQANCSGTWALGGDCNPNPCSQPPPLGACCFGNGCCSVTTQANCSGTWTQGGDCSTNPCPAPSVDCNTNGISDECDISSGFSQDCNANGMPDECDIAAEVITEIIDATGDGAGNALINPAGIDVDSAGNVYVGGNFSHNAFKIATSDCNGNGILDQCDITNGTSLDCNANGIPDECEPDCNGNGIPDQCDITNGTSPNCNSNGTPDECEPDSDGDGTIDDCDNCDNDPSKTDPGICGCGTADTDMDGDGVADCNDNCPTIANADQADSDGNGIGDVCQDCCGGRMDGMMVMPMTLLGIGWMRRRASRLSQRVEMADTH